MDGMSSPWTVHELSPSVTENVQLEWRRSHDGAAIEFSQTRSGIHFGDSFQKSKVASFSRGHSLGRVAAARAHTQIMLDETTLLRLERQHPEGFTSGAILAVFAEHGSALSEATLRKYVQQGLLPRSIRIGKKGQPHGSEGLYPPSVIRQLVELRALMTEELTIEQIRERYFFMRSELTEVRRAVHDVFRCIDESLRRRRQKTASHGVSRLVKEARQLGVELLQRLTQIEDALCDGGGVSKVVVSRSAGQVA